MLKQINKLPSEQLLYEYRMACMKLAEDRMNKSLSDEVDQLEMELSKRMTW